MSTVSSKVGLRYPGPGVVKSRISVGPVGRIGRVGAGVIGDGPSGKQLVYSH